jgi:hypothetical protein
MSAAMAGPYLERRRRLAGGRKCNISYKSFRPAAFVAEMQLKNPDVFRDNFEKNWQKTG